jgi:hypothetical protein
VSGSQKPRASLSLSDVEKCVILSETSRSLIARCVVEGPAVAVACSFSHQPKNKVEKTGVLFGPRKAPANQPRSPRNSPQAVHDLPSSRTTKSPKTPVKPSLHHTQEIAPQTRKKPPNRQPLLTKKWPDHPLEWSSRFKTGINPN